jgi:AcrR family transcriptional regulator
MRKSPSSERSTATVDIILDTVALEIEAVGFARLTTNRVAERAGVSVGSLYQYFPNTHALIAALHDRSLKVHRDVLDRAVAAGTSPHEVIRQVGESIIYAFMARPRWHTEFRLYRNAAEGDRPLDQTLESGAERLAELLRARGVSAEMAPLLAFGIVHGSFGIYEGVIARAGRDWDVVRARQMLGLIVNLVAGLESMVIGRRAYE